MVSSLPPALLKKHFPGAGSSTTYPIETDGESLIIKNVLFDNGKRYDVWIKRFDANRRPIFLNEQTKMLKHTIEEVALLAKEMFSKPYFDEPPVNATAILYGNIGPEEACYQNDLSLPDGDEHKFCSLSDEPIAGLAREIHNALFKIKSGVSLDPNESLLISPTRAKKQESPPVPSSEKPAEKPSTPEKKEELSPSIQKQLPTALKEAKPQPTPAVKTSPPTSPTAKQHVEELNQTLQKAPSPEFFKGLTHRSLSDYSLTRDKQQDEKLEPAYQTFLQVLEKPSEKGDEKAEQMKKWLRDLYLSAYQQHTKLKEVFEKDREGFSDFHNWCTYYAAKAIAGFVLTPKPIEALVAELQKTEIPPDLSVASSAGGWSSFWNAG